MNELIKIRKEKLHTIADARAVMLKKQVEAEDAAKNAAVAALNKVLSDDIGDLHELYFGYFKATGKYAPDVTTPKGKKITWYCGCHGSKEHPHKQGLAYVVEGGTSTYYHTLRIDGTYKCQTSYGGYYGCDIEATDAVDFLAGVETWVNSLYALIDAL
jgi:hypothetical protein